MNGDRAPRAIVGAVVVGAVVVALALMVTRRGNEPKAVPSAAPTPGTSSPAQVVPTSKAQTNDLQAQDNLQNALDAANKIFAQYGAYDRATPIGLVAYAKPGLTYEPADTPSKGPDDISLAVSSRTWAAAAISKTGTCFWIKDVAASPVASYGTGEPCTGESALGARAPGWG